MRDGERAAVEGDGDRGAVGDGAGHERAADPRLQFALQEALERSESKVRQQRRCGLTSRRGPVDTAFQIGRRPSAVFGKEQRPCTESRK